MKQSYVVKSTMETKYISCSTLVSDAVWIKHFIESLNLGIPIGPVNVFCDIQYDILLIKSETQFERKTH